ncbi:MAG TPA: hypothetical protein VD846_05100 [Allosphingosinicella sp.]|nr:hypothetical protein [Allosphingosinicella sp.]
MRPFTPRQRAQNAAFLEALRRTGNPRLAAAELGVHRSTYSKRRAKCAAFAADWDSALKACHAALRLGGGPRPARDGAALRTKGGEIIVGRTRGGRLQLRRSPPGRMTAAGEDRFFEALSASANVRLSAAVTGFSHSAFYYRARRSANFAGEMKVALRVGFDRIDCALYQSFDLLHGPDWGEPRADWFDRIRDCPLPRMTIDQAIQILAMHNRTCRLGWEHREARYRVAGNAEVRREIQAALAVATRGRHHEETGSWRFAHEQPPPPLPPLHLVTGWSKADPAKVKHNPKLALFGGWRIADWRERGGGRGGSG